MTRLTLVGVLTLVTLAYANPRARRTPLNNGKVPCFAESIRETDHYTCDENNNVICLNGWSEPENECRTPICEFLRPDGSTCTCGEHGSCERPNLCACETGWTGLTCEECIPLPGCDNGYCEKAFDCICNDTTKYYGYQCDQPVCKKDCWHGYCVDPGECICEVGWTGEFCDKCITLPGCQHGHCKDPETGSENPLECHCEEGWTGELCDCPICKEGCSLEHGYCDGSCLGECLCHPGWKGANCDECVPYPGCPVDKGGYCNKPWECFCPEGVKDEVCGVDSKFNLLPEYYHHPIHKCRIRNENEKTMEPGPSTEPIRVKWSTEPLRGFFGEVDTVNKDSAMAHLLNVSAETLESVKNKAESTFTVNDGPPDSINY